MYIQEGKQAIISTEDNHDTNIPYWIIDIMGVRTE